MHAPPARQPPRHSAPEDPSRAGLAHRPRGSQVGSLQPTGREQQSQILSSLESDQLQWELSEVCPKLQMHVFNDFLESIERRGTAKHDVFLLLQRPTKTGLALLE